MAAEPPSFLFARIKLDRRKLAVLRALAEGCATVKEVASRLGLKYSEAYYALKKLAEAGLVKIDHTTIPKKYEITKAGLRVLEGVPPAHRGSVEASWKKIMKT